MSGTELAWIVALALVAIGLVLHDARTRNLQSEREAARKRSELQQRRDAMDAKRAHLAAEMKASGKALKSGARWHPSVNHLAPERGTVIKSVARDNVRPIKGSKA